MSRFECPGCSGGFPEPAYTSGQSRCPWCGRAFSTLQGVAVSEPRGDSE